MIAYLFAICIFIYTIADWYLEREHRKFLSRK